MNKTIKEELDELIYLSKCLNAYSGLKAGKPHHPNVYNISLIMRKKLETIKEELNESR